MTTLKPCPFCGSPAAKHAGGYVHCTGENAWCYMKDVDMPTEDWNRRPVEEKLRASLSTIIDACAGVDSGIIPGIREQAKYALEETK